jgi:outer membrane lipoprotein-sorting protein
MTNDEIRRNEEIPMTKPASAKHGALRHSSFGFLSAFGIRHSAFAFLSAFLSGFGWQPPACGANSVLAAWLNSQTNIQTWSAEVIQTRALKSLTQPLTATGRVWFAAPNRFRWELGNPPQTIALRQPEQMLVIYPRLKRAEKYPLTGSHAGPWTDTLALLEAGFPRSQTELESRFRIESESSANGLHEVTLQPRSGSARRMMPHIKIAFATTDFSLRSTELQFADGSRMRNDFTNAVMNPTLDDSLFTFKLHPDFKVTEPLTPK